MKACIEGSLAVAKAVNLCKPDVISAYPITPQTHIVEHLAKMKADGEADFDFIRSDSEFAAASIAQGASAAGGRAYTATSAQGLLYMNEVVYTIAGMRLPIVMTVANRAISSPINIWNDMQDMMTVRDSGWLMLVASTNQAAADFHFVAFKLAEQLKIPVMVNMDGFVLTHTAEIVDLPEEKQVRTYLPDYVPTAGEYLDVMNPVTLGSFVTPDKYQEIRLELHSDLTKSQTLIKKEFTNFKKIFGRGYHLVEYYGDKNAKTVMVAMGSVADTIKDAVDEINEGKEKVALVVVNCFRPFPDKDVLSALKNAKHVIVLDKNVSLGTAGALETEVKRALYGQSKATVTGIIDGLGGRDITVDKIKNYFKKIK